MTDNRLRTAPDQHTSRLILIRHGQTLANEQHLIQGASDGPLTPAGRAEVERLGAGFAAHHVSRVISSDLQRARDTAEAVARHHNLAVEVTPLAREWDCGEWDGIPASEFLRFIKESGQPVSTLYPPGGETLSQVRQRADQLLRSLTADGPGKTVVICSHGDIMRMMLSCLLGLDIDLAQAFRFDNASYSILEHDGQGWKVFAINRVVPS